MTLNAVRAHVFNKMPIRLLAFDKSGSNLQFIGRNKISAHILFRRAAKTAEPKFQSAVGGSRIFERCGQCDHVDAVPSQQDAGAAAKSY